MSIWTFRRNVFGSRDSFFFCCKWRLPFVSTISSAKMFRGNRNDEGACKNCSLEISKAFIIYCSQFDYDSQMRRRYYGDKSGAERWRWHQTHSVFLIAKWYIHWSRMSFADKWLNRKIVSHRNRHLKEKLIIFMCNYHDGKSVDNFDFGVYTCDFLWIHINYMATILLQWNAKKLGC